MLPLRVRHISRDGIVELTGPRDEVFAFASVIGADRITLAVLDERASACWSHNED